MHARQFTRLNPVSPMNNEQIIEFIEMRIETHKQALRWQYAYDNREAIDHNESAISVLQNLLIDVCGYRPVAVAV